MNVAPRSEGKDDPKVNAVVSLKQSYCCANALPNASRFPPQSVQTFRYRGLNPVRHSVEWLQRPENVLAGFIRWTDYRSREAPTAVRIFHHKTGAVVLHPLQDADGTLFYADAESVLAKLPRRGIPMILHETRDKTCLLYTSDAADE